MENILPIYDVIFDSDNNDSVYGITAVSLVDRPAIECDFIALKEEKPIKFYFNDEKREIIGPALIPDKLIYRVYQGQEFFIRFSKEVIEDLAYDFFQKGYLEHLTIEHPNVEGPFDALEDTNKFYNTHCWIETEDFTLQKEYGFDLPLGTWFLGYHIVDEELWNRIKSGELKGFSIEAFLDLRFN